MEESVRIAHEFVDAGSAALNAGYAYVAKPETLFHFTDCLGLLGIIAGGSLWASLATGSNDDSEIGYGVSYADRLLRSGRPKGIAPDFLTAVADSLSTIDPIAGRRIDSDAYIISFCARDDRSVHWLHYGHSGTGCAIGFDPGRLTQPPFNLAPVLYEEADQDRLIGDIVQRIWAVICQHKLDSRDSAREQVLFRLACSAAAVRIRSAAPMLKSPVFANEDEWRLITHDVRVDGKDPQQGVPLTITFRVSGGRIVPYFEYKVPDQAIATIVLGASCPITDTDSTLKILLREARVPSVTVRRSSVPVRP